MARLTASEMIDAVRAKIDGYDPDLAAVEIAVLANRWIGAAVAENMAEHARIVAEVFGPKNLTPPADLRLPRGVGEP